MKATLNLVALFAVAASNAQSIFGDETRAWMVGPAKSVSSGMVMNFSYSANGERIFYNRIDPNVIFNPSLTAAPSSKWFAYDCQRGVSTELMIPGATPSTQLTALGDSKTIFFFDSSNPKLQGFLDLSTGRIQATAITPETLFYAGEKSVAPLLMYEVGESSFGILEPGRQPVVYKVKLRVGFQAPYYADARVIKFASYSRNTNPIQYLDATLDRATGEVAVKEIKSDLWGKLAYVEPEKPFELSGEDAELRIGLPELPDKRGSKPKKTLLDRTTYLCPSGFNPVLHPLAASVVYVDNGALLIRDIKPFDRDLAEKMKLAALKAQALSQAKQVGLALILYASDMEDVLPNGENFVNRLMPYLKNRKMLDGFNYTFGGGPLDQIKDIANTELGFTNGPGGRAVVYADGHAKWVPDKP
ncbi:MAG: hypothetical protein WCK51_13655 [Armatimonadota bacterium]